MDRKYPKRPPKTPKKCTKKYYPTLEEERKKAAEIDKDLRLRRMHEKMQKQLMRGGQENTSVACRHECEDGLESDADDRKHLAKGVDAGMFSSKEMGGAQFQAVMDPAERAQLAREIVNASLLMEEHYESDEEAPDAAAKCAGCQGLAAQAAAAADAGGEPKSRNVLRAAYDSDAMELYVPEQPRCPKCRDRRALRLSEKFK